MDDEQPDVPKSVKEQIAHVAGDVSPYALDPPLPFRPLVQHLTWQDAKAEAHELCVHYLMFKLAAIFRDLRNTSFLVAVFK